MQAFFVVLMAPRAAEGGVLVCGKLKRLAEFRLP
jgi:hypothetical protein